MAIEKMTFIDINGRVDSLNGTLIRCLQSGVFQPEDASKLSEYSIGKQALLRNPYSALLQRITETAAQLNFPLGYREFGGLPTGNRKAFIKESDSFVSEMLERRAAPEEAEDFLQSARDPFLQLYSKVKLLHDAHNLRRYVTVKETFHLVGFIPTRDKEAFLKLVGDIPDIVVSARPAGGDPRLEVPVRLRNNAFTRPFEMFVNMYGSPAYNDIDPTSFVCCTYCLLFGMMFGDVGQGLVVSLLGFLLWKLRRVQLGQIMARVGVVGAFFGVLYGSVFGFEDALDPLYHALGFAEKPVSVMDSATTTGLLLTTVAMGVVLILTVMLLNICIGVKQRSLERSLFSQNGVAGLVFYASVIVAVVSMLLFGKSLFSAPFVLLCLVLPLVAIFFREPLHRLLYLRSKGARISSDEDLKSSFTFKEGGLNILDVFSSHYVTSRFGRIPTDSYNKLVFYEDEPFVLHPIKTDQDYIWCLYAAAKVHEDKMDAIFRDLRFERVYIPDEFLSSNEAAQGFIRKCVEGEPLPVAGARQSKPTTMLQYIFPDGVGSFFIESFFEMFEVLLSFITNTVSFLRIGGFVMVHAGLMSVVFSISGMFGPVGAVVTIAVGNLFVMGMEGLLVGIQALRLEFYEMFGRFFDGAGTRFEPVRVNY